MTIITTILTIIGSALGLWLLYAKRKKTPTVEERVDDLDLELSEILKELNKLRQKGDMAGADALLRRLSNRSSDYKLHIYKTGSNSDADAERERLGDRSTQGNQDSSGKPTGN